MKYSILFFVIVSLFSCNKEQKKANNSEDFVMYKQSEMATLMRKMFATNEKVRAQIIAGKVPNSFPKEFLKIHTAILTDPSDRNASFEVFSKRYIADIEAIYIAPKDSLKQRFNTAINSCVACHQTTCTGPIPRIKKLLIK